MKEWFETFQRTGWRWYVANTSIYDPVCNVPTRNILILQQQYCRAFYDVLSRGNRLDTPSQNRWQMYLFNQGVECDVN